MASKGEWHKIVEQNKTNRMLTNEDWVFENRKEKELGLDSTFVCE